jgi:coenzyme F420-reducing hydrogenase gamma subunit
MNPLPVLNEGDSRAKAKPRLGVFKFASCDGCQLSILDCEDELLAVAGRVEIGYFLEATRRPLEGSFDVALVEGSVSAPEQEDAIRDVRARSRCLITLGACASHGGIQALRNAKPIDEVLPVVYASPQYVATLEHSRPASAYVKVDLELPGCPIDKGQLLRVLAQLLTGARPYVDRHALCLDCKRQNLVCILVARGEPCMGPVTTSGCGVLCPAHDRACYSCFGPAPQPNTQSLTERFLNLGLGEEAVQRLFQTFYCESAEFRQEAGRHAERTSRQ